MSLKGYVQQGAEVILCGGGAKNVFLFEQLTGQFPEFRFTTSEAHGIATEWLEATAFAWFAKQTITHQPLDLRQITGSTQPAVMGGIYLADG